jgi:hypothetical protein
MLIGRKGFLENFNGVILDTSLLQEKVSHLSCMDETLLRYELGEEFQHTGFEKWEGLWD